MKKGFLINLLFIPIVIGCNGNATPGIDNPFKDDDDYTVKNLKIGFNLADHEKKSRALSTKEINDVTNTFNKSEQYDREIKKVKIEIHERNYERAFAGEFKQGYTSYNVKKDDEIVITSDNKDSNEKYRKLTIEKSNTTNDYSYGRTYSEINSSSTRHFRTSESDSSEPSNNPKSSSEKIGDRITDNKIKKTTDSLTVFSKTDGVWKEETIDKAFNISQGEYLSMPDVNSGADREGNVFLYKEEKKEYENPKGTGVKGVFELKDGRKYRAMVNSLQVSKLKLIREKTADDWYIVSYARKYTETIITSKEIEPNVQIVMLKEPIPISFIEEYHYFSNELTNDETKALFAELEKENDSL